MRRLTPSVCVCVCVSKYKPHKMVIIKLNYNKYTTKHTHSWHTHTDSENRATFRVLSVIDFVVFSAVVGLPAQLLLFSACATVRMIIIVIIVGLQVMRSCSTLLMTFLCKMRKTLRPALLCGCGCGLLWFVNICSPSFICL